MRTRFFLVFFRGGESRFWILQHTCIWRKGAWRKGMRAGEMVLTNQDGMERFVVNNKWVAFEWVTGIKEKKETESKGHGSEKGKERSVTMSWKVCEALNWEGKGCGAERAWRRCQRGQVINAVHRHGLHVRGEVKMTFLKEWWMTF